MIQNELDLPEEPTRNTTDYLVWILGWVVTLAAAIYAFLAIGNYMDGKHTIFVSDGWEGYREFDSSYWGQHHDTATVLLFSGLLVAVIVLWCVIYNILPYHRRVKGWHREVDPIIESESKKLQEAKFKLISVSAIGLLEEHEGLNVGPAFVGGNIGLALTSETEIEKVDAIRVAFFLNGGEIGDKIITETIPMKDEEGEKNFEVTVGEENTINWEYATYCRDGSIYWNPYWVNITVKQSVVVPVA